MNIYILKGRCKMPSFTIIEAVTKISDNTLVLPEIQRKFVWDKDQICSLLDSLMRDYPIGTLLLWNLPDLQNLIDMRFYKFLDYYQERFHEDNDQFIPVPNRPLTAVIDGQQRLTALNIAFRGSYANKLPRIWWPEDYNQNDLPEKKLYLDLSSTWDLDDPNNDNKQMYRFEFLTTKEFDDHPNNNYLMPLFNWGDWGDVRITKPGDVAIKAIRYLDGRNINNDTSLTILCKFFSMVFLDQTISYFEETTNDPDRVLDMFIRMNSGGVPLSYSDLIMSMTISQWDVDAKKEIDGLVKSIRTDNYGKYSITRDFVLKACLMLIDADVKFQIRNFSNDSIALIEDNWAQIRRCLLTTFRLIKSFNINDKALRAKNAVIPIAYYLYHKQGTYPNHKLFEEIEIIRLHSDQRKVIKRWLLMSLLKGVFGGQGDSILTSLRRVIKTNIELPLFPINAINQEFAGTNKDISFSEEFIERLLTTRKKDPNCLTILSLLFPGLDNAGVLEIDHIHPAASFKPRRLSNHEFLRINQRLMDFYRDKANFETIPNLHLLTKELNRTKGDTAFADWIAIPAIEMIYQKENSLIPSDLSVTFNDFELFTQVRKQLLSSILLNLLNEDPL